MQSASRWAEALDRGGPEALRSTGFRGRRPGLSDEQIEQLRGLVRMLVLILLVELLALVGNYY